MNILNRLEVTDSGTICALYGFARTKSVKVEGGKTTAKKVLETKCEMFHKSALKSLLLHRKGVTLRIDVGRLLSLKLYLEREKADRQVEQIIHLAKKTNLSPLQVAEHFDKLSYEQLTSKKDI